jgi:CheY-like chemotaxis protein
VLVVDDNRDAAESLAMMLELLGNDVRMAHDGIEAVEESARFEPELVLMDLGMPRLNGHDAARRIRRQAHGATATIIALTGWGQDADRARSREAGCDGHLVKPVTVADLQSLLEKLDPRDAAPMASGMAARAAL